MLSRLPWRRAPRAGLSSPATAGVALLLGVVVAFIAAGTVFHVSASGSAALQNAIGKRCPDSTGVTVSHASRGFFANSVGGRRSVLDGSHERIRAVAAEQGLDRSRRTRIGAQVPITGAREEIYARLVTSEGLLDHLRPIAGGGADGLWMSTHLAKLHDLEVGDRLAVGGFETKVAAIYPTIKDPVDDYWCSQRSEILSLLLVGDLPVPPPPVFLSGELMDAALAAGVPMQVDQLLLWSSRTPANTTEADRLAAATEVVRAKARELASERLVVDHPLGPRTAPGSGAVSDTAAYPARIGHAAQISVGTSLLPLATISLLVGLAAVVGLARQWLQRRNPEIRLLWIRGATPAALGVKAVLELAVPLAVGTVAGLLLARATVPALAPAGDLDGWALPAASAAAVVALLAGIAVLGFAATVVVRRQFQPRRRRSPRLLRWVPWELAAAGLAVLSWRRLSAGALVAEPTEPLPRVDMLALLFPLLCLIVVLGVAVRLSGLGLRAGHRLRGWRVPALLWAARRSAAQARLSVALVAVGGLAVGVIAVGVGLAGTERQALQDKGQVFLGSDTAVQLIDSISGDAGDSGGSLASDSAVPPALRGQATMIAIRAGLVRGGYKGRVLVVDPATLADGMPWRKEWSGRDLSDLTGLLGPPGSDGRVPVIQVGSLPPSEFLFDGLPPMQAVATVPTFPGREHVDGMLVMSWDGFAEGDRRGFTRFVWTRGDPAFTVGELERSGEATARALIAARLTEALPFLVVAWTFDFFVTLGLVLAAVAAAMLLVAVEARRRASALATGLLRRMGLRTGELFASHTTELAALAAVALGAGLLGGWLVLTIAGHHFDPYPRLSPQPIAASLVPLALLMTLAGLVAVLVVAVIAARSALRGPVRELLRG